MADQTISGAIPVLNETALKISSSNNIINLNAVSSLVSTTHALNNVVSDMYGVTVRWFRATPVDRSADVIFHEYTLHNVADCGFDINVMYNDTGYDDAALQYNMMGIQYQIPLTVDIAVANWEAATNNDGTLPQKRDIVYIPQSNKLYQVASMNPVKSIGAQITSYKCNLSIYKPERSVVVNDSLAETIDSYTNSIEKLFGDDIKSEINDIVADKQTSPYSSTHKDKYKVLYNTNCIIEDHLYSDGHLISKNYYKCTNISHNTFVKYNHDIDNITEGRMFSIIFRLHDNKTKNVKLSNKQSFKNYTTYKINNTLDSQYVNINRGMINIFGEYIKSKNCIQIDNKQLESYNVDLEKLGQFSINNNCYNILTGNNKDKTLLSIDLINNTIIIKINSKIYPIIIDKQFEEDKWYNLSINLSKNGNIRIFDLTDNVKEIGFYEFTLTNFKNLLIDEYLINSSNIDLRKIRLYNTNINDIDKQLIDIISEYSTSESNLILVDNIDEYDDSEYYGSQR